MGRMAVNGAAAPASAAASNRQGTNSSGLLLALAVHGLYVKYNSQPYLQKVHKSRQVTTTEQVKNPAVKTGREFRKFQAPTNMIAAVSHNTATNAWASFEGCVDQPGTSLARYTATVHPGAGHSSSACVQLWPFNAIASLVSVQAVGRLIWSSKQQLQNGVCGAHCGAQGLFRACCPSSEAQGGINI